MPRLSSLPPPPPGWSRPAAGSPAATPSWSRRARRFRVCGPSVSATWAIAHRRRRKSTCASSPEERIDRTAVFPLSGHLMPRFVFYTILLLSVCGYAFWRGRSDERLAAAVCLIASLASLALLGPDHLRYSGVEVGVLAVDLFTFL